MSDTQPRTRQLYPMLCSGDPSRRARFLHQAFAQRASRFSFSATLVQVDRPSLWPVMKSIRVNDREYAVHSQLGSGGFAFVYKCRPAAGGKDEVAVKVMQLEQASEAEAEAALFRSVGFHPNIAKFLDWEARRVGRLTEVVIAQELLGDSLFSMMQAKSARPNDFFDDGLVLGVVSQMASALSYLHNQDISHRDM